MEELIKSISYSQDEIINNIIKLYCPKGIECDPTYSKGNFYKNIEKPKYMLDLYPRYNFVVKADCRKLPFKSKSIASIMFDPPFLATKGPSLSEVDTGNNIIVKRFSHLSDEKALHSFYVSSLVEFYRVLKDKGVLIFKCQDKVSSGKQYFSHCFISNEATKIGFYPKDLFLLLAKNRIVADWQKKNQQHSRKFHSYFWVFQKINKKIKYL